MGVAVPRAVRRGSLLAVLASLLLVYAMPSAAAAVPFGNVLVLDGIDDYANIPDNATLDLGDADGEDLTVEAFFYVPNESNATTDVIFYKGSAYVLSVIFRTTSADTVRFQFWSTNVTSNILSNDTNITAGWHHVAAVFDNEFTGSNDRVAIYLDGAEFANSTAFEYTPGLNNSTNLLAVGANSGAVPLEGWLDEARFSQSVRYTGPYSVPTSPFSNDANTRALWHFDEAAASTSFADSSGNGNTLTGQNGAQTGTPATTVSIVDLAFQPATVTAPLGGTVTWTNNGSMVHTSTSNGFDATAGPALWDSPDLSPGQTFPFTFNVGGNYGYHCTIHPTMQGSVVVKPTAQPTSGTTSTTFTITWAVGSIPSGYRADVIIKRPGQPWVGWKVNQSGTQISAQFTPDGGTGTYGFAVRLRKASTGGVSGWAGFPLPVS
jgi:plastocyanin